MLSIRICPQCDKSYSDSNISYCLEDGSRLSFPYFRADSNIQPSLFDTETPTVISNSINLGNLEVEIRDTSVRIGDDDLDVAFCRTLRIPDDGSVYDLPASLGDFPVFRVSDYADKVPEHWKKTGGVFIPMYQSEALFIEFRARKRWQPVVAKVATGKVNAITGEEWHQHLFDEEQDYVVVPPQQWLDGYKTSTNIVRQFVAMPLGEGYSVESQMTGAEESGGMQIIVYKPFEGLFEYSQTLRSVVSGGTPYTAPPTIEMGIGAGGKIKQKIYEDKYGVETWDADTYGRFFVHIVNSRVFKEITGVEPPSTPIEIDTYLEYEIPFFEVYDEHLKDVKPQEKLFEIKPIDLIDKMKQTPKNDKLKVEDGEW